MTIYFVLFYAFTDFNWQLGNYLGGNGLYVFWSNWRGVRSHLSTVLSFIIYNQISYQLFFQFFYRRQRRVLAVLLYLLAALPVMIGCRYLIQEVIAYHLWGSHNYSAAMRQPARYFMDNIYFAVYYSGFGVVFFFIQFSAYAQKCQSELLVQNRNAELSFLRSQINPHFLFNSLNNVYTLVYQASEKALPSIGKLSELLRYMLYEKEEFVPLLKELQYLRNFIDLQLMRYDFEPAIKVELDASGDQALKIAPLTLIPFVENAFKHGDLRDPNHPLLIRLYFIDNEMNFLVMNKVSSTNKDQTGGIGLENVSKRLSLIYGGAHHLNIDDDGRLFSVKLTLSLHE
ncbi:sensor histidine kinase [Mucilaginibacter sp. CAU 1740]|uniref:sensor histidine kinase n=1 Tax=Mucilaginibacter sp. CAU 1740 TaxID=3140365 RepID=UPI00325B46B7